MAFSYVLPASVFIASQLTSVQALAPAEAPATSLAKMSAGNSPLLRPAGSVLAADRFLSRCNTYTALLVIIFWRVGW